VQTKKKITLANRFKCPFCANEDVVECKMDRRKGIGALACRLCGASYQMPIHHLHEPIDVFSEWLDDCESAERANQNGGAAAAAPIDERFEDNDIGDEDDEDNDDILDQGSGLHQKQKGNSGGGQSNGISTTDLGLGDSDSDDE
jgi:transcription elongation factor Elf1